MILEGGEEYKYFAPGVGGIRTEPRSSSGPDETEDLVNVRQLGAAGWPRSARRCSSSTGTPARRCRRRSAVRRPRRGSPERARPARERSPVLVRVDGVSKAFREGETATEVLHGVGLELARGATTSLVGRSGSGKSTLISLLAGLLLPDAGTRRCSTVAT